MTTVVAVQTEDDVILAWDSKATRDNEQGTLKAQKVWCRDGIVFAVSGSTRFMDLIYTGSFPPYDGSEARRWIITNLVPAVQELIANSGHGEILLNESSLTSGLMVVVDGQIFGMDTSLSPFQFTEGIYGMGSGADYAKGALYAGKNIEEAVGIAAILDPYTGGPINVASANELIMAEEVD